MGDFVALQSLHRAHPNVGAYRGALIEPLDTLSIHRAYVGQRPWQPLPIAPATGMADPLAVYQFSEADPLDDKTSNGRDLTHHAGTATYQVREGTTVLYFNGALRLYAALDAALQLTGAVTLEAVIMHVSGDYAISMAGGVVTESAAHNYLYSLAGRYYTLQEYGSGVNQIASWSPSNSGGLDYIALTRNTAGTSLNLYRDGRHISTETLIAPTGGTSAILRVGMTSSGAYNWSGSIQSFRITAEEATGAQVNETWGKIRPGGRN